MDNIEDAGNTHQKTDILVIPSDTTKLTRQQPNLPIQNLQRLRDEGFKNREIAEKLGISTTTVQYWINKLNLKKRSKGLNWMILRNRLVRLLRKNGPTPKREAVKTLGLNYDQIETILIIFPETFQKLNFTVDGRKYSRRFHSLSEDSPVLTLKNDPRVVDFAASKINMKVRTSGEAKSIVHLLKYQLGSNRAHAVVEKLGYRYKET